MPLAIVQQHGNGVWVSEFTGYFEHSRVLVHLPAGTGGPPRLVTLATPRSDIDALAAGPAGSVWFADFGADELGELGRHGGLRLFPDRAPYGGLSDITAGPGGAMWFTGQAGLVGRSSGGVVSELAVPSGAIPNGIAAGPGGTIWVTETGTGAVAEITLR